MDNEMDSIIPESGTQPAPKIQFEEKKPVARTAKRVKPLIEGINSPKSTQDIILVKPNLSPKEKELVSEAPSPVSSPSIDSHFEPNPVESNSEARLMPESVANSVNKKDHHIGRWLLIFVVLLILVVGGYEFYIWSLGKGQQLILGHSHPAADVILDQPFPLAGDLPQTTPSSTLISGTASSTPPTSTPAAVLQIKINSTPTGFLNVRETPSSSGKVLTQVKPGETYFYTKTQNNWYYITYSGFNQGWVSGQYVTKQ